MKEFYIELLDLEHGQEVREFLKEIGVDVGDFKFSVTRSNRGVNRYYGVRYDGTFASRTYGYTSGKIMTLEQARKYFSKGVEVKSKEKLKLKDMRVVKTEKDVQVNGVSRDITIVAMFCNGEVKTGYSVRMPNDKPIEGLSERIALGRAMSDKTNLTKDMVLGIGMDKKYILHAIADHFMRVLSKGGVVKGIK